MAGRRAVAAAAATVMAAAVAALTAVPATAAAGRAQGGASRATAAAVAAVAATARPSVTFGPAGFWFGTDSSTIKITGTVPYQEPVIGGTYGLYVGMAGNWANITDCHKIVVWSSANSAQANANYSDHAGLGTGAYWFMGGPGVDPHYNGTSNEAYVWGEQQAAQALADAASYHITYPVLFMDIELPGDAPDYTPAPDNGWNSVYTSPCSGVVKTDYVPAGMDRADLDGFATYLMARSSYKAGVYSAPDIWAEIFGTGTDASLPNTYEWTYESFTSSLAHRPSAWCLTGSASSTCASFFGGQTSSDSNALMWQWSGGGGSYNGVGDFDQIDGHRTP